MRDDEFHVILMKCINYSTTPSNYDEFYENNFNDCLYMLDNNINIEFNILIKKILFTLLDNKNYYKPFTCNTISFNFNNNATFIIKNKITLPFGKHMVISLDEINIMIKEFTINRNKCVSYCTIS